MAQLKKKNSDEVKTKSQAHKDFAAKVMADLSEPSWINRPVGNALVAHLEGPDPFTFVITIVINPAITIKGINLNAVIAKPEDFKTSGGNITCTIKAFVSIFTFPLLIDAEGEPETVTTFNMTCDDKKVFDEDQELSITSTGRGGYSNKNVPLP